MEDLVKRLRETAADEWGETEKILNEAADEIESLREHILEATKFNTKGDD